MSEASGWILIVEDDRDIREAFAQVLEEEGYDLAMARHGLEALELLKTRPPPALILLDLMMPVMDGSQFRSEQRKNPEIADIPVLVISADASVTERVRSMEVAGFLKKPVSFDDLVGAVKRYCVSRA